MPSVLVDTNLMLLLAVGLTDKSYIAKHKRLAVYDIDDFDSVSEIVNGFAALVSCPNVWSETSNFVRYVNEPLRSRISETLRQLIGISEEIYTESRFATKRQEYSSLGVTDAVLLTMAQTGSVLLTDDLPVYLAASKAGYQAINYNHVREARYSE